MPDHCEISFCGDPIWPAPFSHLTWNDRHWAMQSRRERRNDVSWPTLDLMERNLCPEFRAEMSALDVPIFLDSLLESLESRQLSSSESLDRPRNGRSPPPHSDKAIQWARWHTQGCTTMTSNQQRILAH